MRASLGEQLRRDFHHSSMERFARKLKTGRQREEGIRIMDRCAAAIKKEDDLLKKHHGTRVEAEYRRIMNSKASNVRHHRPTWADVDCFDDKAIERQANLNVASRHVKRIGRIKDIQTRELERLYGRAYHNNKVHGRARASFNKTVDRRSGIERRQR